jgi:hypothetical protein
MRCLKTVEINDSFVDEIWNKVASSGSYYSIGDGVKKEVFRKVLFNSNFVLQTEGLLIRLEVRESCIEIHPISFGPSTFRYAKEALKDIVDLRDRLFAGKLVCCIIPDGMRGAKRLARIAGMTSVEKLVRPLSGVPILCEVFIWR